MTQTASNTFDAGRRPFSSEQVRSVAPALERHTQERLMGELWSRPGLDRRDRSLISIAALIARGQASALGYCEASSGGGRRPAPNPGESIVYGVGHRVVRGQVAS